MPDITMCKDHDCAIKENCHRYTASPSDYQSYFVGSPKDDDGSCSHYWGDNQHQILEQLEQIVKPMLDKSKKK